MTFQVSCVPPAALHHAKKVTTRGGFARMYDTPELQNTKAILTTLFRPYQPPEPFTGPIRLAITLVYPFIGKHGKRIREAGANIPHDTKPDCSNSAKTIEDILGLLCFFENDSRVCDLRVRKFYGPSPGITIHIESAEASVGA